MIRHTCVLPFSDAKRWLIDNGLRHDDETVISLAEELKRFFDIGADQ